MPPRLPPAPSRAALLSMYEGKLKVGTKTPNNHYIIDELLAEKIAKHAGDITGCHVVEPGPGPGLLTRHLLEKGARRVVAVERLQNFEASLKELQAAVGESQLDVAIPMKLELFWADHSRSFAPFKDATPGDWKTGALSSLKLIGMCPGGQTFNQLSRATSSLMRRADIYQEGPAEAVLCVRDVDFQKCEFDENTLTPKPTSSTRARAMLNVLFDLEYLERHDDASSTLPPMKGPAHIVRYKPSQRATEMSDEMMSDLSNLTFWLYSKTTSNLGKVMAMVGPGAEGLLKPAGLDPKRKIKDITVDELMGLLKVYHDWEYKQAAGARFNYVR